MNIDWKNVLEQSVGTLIASLVIAFTVQIYNIVSGGTHTNIVVGVGVLIIVIAVALKWQALCSVLNMVGRWTIDNWSLIASLICLFGVVYAV